MKVRGHGNGYLNHRTWKVISENNNVFCKVDGHKWCTYKNDPTQEFCVRCNEFRKKGAE